MPANFASFYQSFIPTFLRELSKPFFVDPMTYAFARDINNLKRQDKVKKSFRKLIDYYGKHLSLILSKRQLIPRDLFSRGRWQKPLMELIVKKTLDFQRDLLKPKTPAQLSLIEYTKMLGTRVEPEEIHPLFLVAPYFYFELITDPWYRISLELAKMADARKRGMPLFSTICASKQLLLDDNVLSQIAEDYSGFDGYLIWFSQLDTEKDGEEYLKGLVHFIRSLDKLKKPIIMLYGSEFEILLCKVAEQYRGHCRGICYSETKDVDAETPRAGGAPKRFYFDLTGTKLSESVARSFFSDNPSELCRCRICKGLMPNSPRSAHEVADFFDRAGLVEMRRHFMVKHHEKIERIMAATFAGVGKNLSTRKKKGVDLKADFYGIPTAHLLRWQSALERK